MNIFNIVIPHKNSTVQQLNLSNTNKCQLEKRKVTRLGFEPTNLTSSVKITLMSQHLQPSALVFVERMYRLRTPIATNQTQLSNLKIVQQQRTTGDCYASRRSIDCYNISLRRLTNCESSASNYSNVSTLELCQR